MSSLRPYGCIDFMNKTKFLAKAPRLDAQLRR